MKRVLLGALVGLIALAPLFWIVVVAAGGGHGTYIPAKLFFPFSMLLAGNGPIGPASLVVAALQWATYGAVIGGASKRPFMARGLLAAVHAMAVLVCLSIRYDNF